MREGVEYSNYYRIQKEYICDGIKNCPDDDTCNDEKDCTNLETIIFWIICPIFIGFILSIFIYCFFPPAAELATQNQNNQNQVTVATLDLFDNNDFFIPDVTSGQAIYTLPSPSDTPPSYDTLFPLRTISRDAATSSSLSSSTVGSNKNTNSTEIPPATNPSST